jgi:hypothetical protein
LTHPLRPLLPLRLQAAGRFTAGLFIFFIHSPLEPTHHDRKQPGWTKRAD